MARTSAPAVLHRFHAAVAAPAAPEAWLQMASPAAVVDAIRVEGLLAGEDPASAALEVRHLHGLWAAGGGATWATRRSAPAASRARRATSSPPLGSRTRASARRWKPCSARRSSRRS